MIRSPFQQYSPATLRWWHAFIERDVLEDYGHIRTLRLMIGGRSADQAEQLEYCHQRVVVEGARSVSGLWCVCLAEDAPETASRRGGAGGDSVAALVCVKRDLESAADSLPISWKATERVFKAQDRAGVYGARLSYYLKGLKVREIDRWQEPRDATTGRPASTSLTFYLMSLFLGGSPTARCTKCRHPITGPLCAHCPEPGSLVERDLFTARYTASLEPVAALYAGPHQQEAA